MQPSDMQAISADFNRALQMQGAGQLAEAQALYADVLTRAPGHVGALHLLGVCHFQQGRFAEGVPLVEQALALKPDYAEAHNNLGNGLKALRRHDDAIAHYRRALEIRPDFADVNNNLGVILTEIGRYAEAMPYFASAIALAPTRADTFNNAAATAARLGRHADAIMFLQKAVTLQPRYADAYNNLGGVLRELGRHEEALANFDRALAIRPNYVTAHYNRGNGLAALYRYEEALASYDRAIALDPRHAQSFNNRGIVLQALQRPEQAIASLDSALEIDPARAESWCNRGNAYRDMHRFDAALADYARAIEVRVDYPEALFNRSILHLLRGDFESGWREYEQRWRFDKFIARSSGSLPRQIIERLQLAPERAAFSGRRCLVVGEQGIGDQVMFASLLTDLSRDAAAVTCLCTGKLRGLFARSFPEIRFIDVDEVPGDLLDKTDVVVAIGSLAHAYRSSLADFTGAAYLRPTPEKVAAWQQRFGAGDGRPVIGLSWRGGTVETRGAGRSLSLEDFLPLMQSVDAHFVSLQYGDTEREIATFNARHDQSFIYVPRDEIEAFDDLAALVAATDGVLSVQTALIHLCGALGHDCVTLVPRQPEWRYGLVGEKMPWYGSVRLLRQADDGDWAPLLARVAEALREDVAGR